MNRVFSENSLDVLAQKVRKLLKETGYSVQYEPMFLYLKEKGLKESSDGRLVFDDALIDEFVSFQKKRQAEKKKTVSASSGRQSSDFSMSLGNMVPKYYDYSSKTPQLAQMEHLKKMAKFAHVEKRISNIALPFSVTDIPLATAPIEGFLGMVRLTDKYCFSIDPYSLELVKYLVELSEIFLGTGQQNKFIDHCNCINPILRLEERTAAVMFERAKYNIDSLMTSMPTAGGNAPVTLDGTVIQGTSEILGGLIFSYLLNPEIEHVGYISSSVMDFRTATTTQSSPETVLVDCGVVELMEFAFGGNTRIGGRTYVSATRPGMQAVFEKMLKAAAYQKYTGSLSYAGGGILDNGAMLSPEQLMIDMNIAESFHSLHEVELKDDNVEAVIMDVASAGTGDFLSTDHTLNNYRGSFWEPFLFTHGSTMSEQEILDKSNGYFTDKLKSYSGYDFEEDKVSEGEKILIKAKKELL